MTELVDKMLRKHMMELIDILDGKSAPSQPPSRPSPILIWPFVMKELIHKTSLDGKSAPSQPPPPSRPSSILIWPFVMKELISKTPPYGITPPPPSPEPENWESELLDLPPPPPPPSAARPTTLPTRIRHRIRRLRFFP